MGAGPPEDQGSNAGIPDGLVREAAGMLRSSSQPAKNDLVMVLGSLVFLIVMGSAATALNLYLNWAWHWAALAGLGAGVVAFFFFSAVAAPQTFLPAEDRVKRLAASSGVDADALLSAGQRAMSLCPGCGSAAMAREGFCSRCGYNDRTGKKRPFPPPPGKPKGAVLPARSPGRRWARRLVFVAVAGIIALGTALVLTGADWRGELALLPGPLLVIIVGYAIYAVATDAVRCDACGWTGAVADIRHWMGRCPNCHVDSRFTYARLTSQEEKVVHRGALRAKVVTTSRYTIERDRTYSDLVAEAKQIWRSAPHGWWKA